MGPYVKPGLEQPEWKASYEFSEMFPNRWLDAHLLQGKDVTLKIARIHLERMLSERKGEEVKAVITFERTKRQLILNKTNGVCLRTLFGCQTGDWIGKRVTLFPATPSDQGLQVRGTDLAIRIRGSPDITDPVEVNEKVGREYVVHVLVPTGAPVKPPPPRKGNGKPGAVAQQEAARLRARGHTVTGPNPEPDPITGELLDGEPF